MYFANGKGRSVLNRMVSAIQENKKFLGDVDGLIGDGDHGMNMNKGFSEYGKRFGEDDISFSEGLNELGTILLTEIGGSMGPIYGTLLMGIAEKLEGSDKIGLKEFADALENGKNELFDIVEARVGDKTLIDCLEPACKAVSDSVGNSDDFAEALKAMKAAAEKGRDSTKNLQAKFGRSARLGERSVGVLDAGSCSCCIILQAMADGITEILEG